MADVAIRIEGLSKKYRIGKLEKYKTLRESLTDAVSAPFRRMRSMLRRSELQAAEPPSETIWALKDISFEVPRGAVLGVIGRNGAGKSTLLKVLSRITEPTEGRVHIRGRVGSLLEVGTGFHGELSGRENIFLNGAILGMKRAEIARKFDEIVAFAEVEKFIDTPVKRYSSGMYMRLAFAVAAHLDPEILIVDEVLAVGDAAFQKKCLGMMGEVSRHGRTVIFVSHNMNAVQTLCARAVWLEAGRFIDDDHSRLVVGRYLQANAVIRTASRWVGLETAPGRAAIRLHQAALVPSTLTEESPITVETPIELEFRYWNFRPDAALNVTVIIYNAEEVCVLASASQSVARQTGLIREACEIPGNLLNSGTYRVRLLVVEDTTRILLDLPEVIVFEVSDVKRDGNWHGTWPGAVRPKLYWRSELLSPPCQLRSEHSSVAG